MRSKSATTDAGTRADRIAFSVLRAIAEQRLTPGMRLGESDLATVFDVSRTIVRQALTQLAAHGVVGVRPKKGWYVIEPTADEIRQTFAARRLLEGALLRDFVAHAKEGQIDALEAHIGRQHAAVAGDDVALRTHLLTDFHLKIAEMNGNVVLARMVRDLTMRTNLISMLYQSGQEASYSAGEHERILAAVRARDADEAVRLMAEHLENVEAGLRGRTTIDPVQQLRKLLQPAASAADDVLPTHPSAA